MKTYSVSRTAAAHILKYRQQQKTATFSLLKDVLSGEELDKKYILDLCEYLVILQQYTATVESLLEKSKSEKVSLSENQLALLKIFNASAKSIETTSVQQYNLSLQIH